MSYAAFSFLKKFTWGWKIKRRNEDFYYDGSAFGGCGNEIQIQGINAHYGEGIDEANSLLLYAYDASDSWSELVNSAAEKILDEIKTSVLPKFES